MDYYEEERKNFDFKTTYVYQILDSSYKFKEKYPNPESIWVEPERFLDLYKGYIKEAVSSYDGDFWNLIFGYEGSGKSSLSLMLFTSLAGKEKILTNTIFLQNEYAKIVYFISKNNMKKEVILIDDAHYVFGKYNTLTKETLSVIQLARFIRDQQIIHIINTQSPTQLYRDIWFERINNYIYTFKLKKLLPDGNITYRMYACVYLDSNDLKADMKYVRNVADWKFILSNYPPDIITRFDLLFDKFTNIYNEYKNIKQFYKQFYSYLRGRGVVKGEDFDTIFKLLYYFLKGKKYYVSDKNVAKRLLNFGFIDKNLEIIDEELRNIAKRNESIIIKRFETLENIK